MSPAPEPAGPDCGEALRTWLRSEAEVTAVTGARVALSLTGSAPAIRYGMLTEVPLGGGAVRARYSVECWGQGGTNVVDDGTSYALARTVARLATNFCGIYAGWRVAGAAAPSLSRQDDVTTGRPRHIVELSFVATP